MSLATDEKKPRKRAVRKEKSGEESNSPIWKCKVCIDQYFGGPRCSMHNPTPEQREANPDAYPKVVFAVALKHPDEQVRCRSCGWYGSAEEGTLARKQASRVRLDCPRCKQLVKWAVIA